MAALMILVLLLAGLQTEQPRPPVASRGVGTGTSAVSGRVIDGATKLPLGGVKVSLVAAPGKSIQVVSDDDGRYEFVGIAAGKYQFAVHRPDYFLAAADGSPIMPFNSPFVAVADGKRVEGVDFIMKRGASIRGTITDDLGQPIANAVITALMLETPLAFRAGHTDQQGAYEIRGLPNGTYVVDAMHPLHERTYYPGVTTPRDAAGIRVGSGDQVRGLDIITAGAKPRITGRIVSVDGSIPTNLELIAESSPAKSRISLTGRQVKDGRFSLASLKRGRYVVWARGRFGDDTHAAAMPVDVGDVGADIELILAPSGAIEGRVVTESGEPLPSAHLAVAALLADGQTAVQFSSPDQSDVGEDGTFRIGGLFGDRIVQVERLPSPWMIKKILNGRRELSPPHLTITPGMTITTIQIVIGQ